ncbi:gas vesicle protein GvpG [Halococcus morrhuae DSM 1307]|uniref:gas vesicle protein GvpG n=1 Tax=Halococcus morrhuae TaxID=2250 RepID=UPI003F865772
MFIIDDLLLRPIVAVGNVIHSMAVEELYDVGAIRDEIKENRLLFEIGDRSEEEYERRREELRTQLDVAREARETLTNKVEVKQ